jgi:hypothetical protein
MGKDVDLNVQLATNVAVVLNRRVKNPHIRAEMIKFIAYLVPQSFFNRGKHQASRHDRDDSIYKDVFF